MFGRRVTRLVAESPIVNYSGYKSQPKMKSFLDQCEQMGLRIVTLHTSGPADEEAIQRLIDTVHPTSILPVHTENPGWFSKT